jgi:uncharacterized protein (DUF2235 family)
MKNIVLLSDGTGNSAAKLFKTNVWRLYQSLDLEPERKGVRQIACYNDGVGTSAFRPAALLGGAFGYGLKRNVLHLYEFLCQHWEPGDKIYIFGFSRGAFTARLLAGLIAQQGILIETNTQTLQSAIRDLYRRYRFDRYNVINLPGLVKCVRNARKKLIRGWRCVTGHGNPLRHLPGGQLPSGRIVCPEIAFLGVWDTVAAYGSPLAELTRGIDRFLFPLSMPDRLLHKKIQIACHALALDDERDTFHPLLWDERHTVNPGRLKQVWFAGMHADVGGGYPDDALSIHPLNWMMREAAAAGLHYLPRAEERFAPPSSQSAVLHDSRKGLGGYYRYQPRRLSAYLFPDDVETTVMRDPSTRAEAHVESILLHHSVLDRITASAGRYAPIVLPADFNVVQATGTIVPSPESAPARDARLNGQRRVWDLVWKKRVNYFLMVGASLWLASIPFWGDSSEVGACETIVCAISPVIRTIGAFVPAILQYWTDALAINPGWTVLFVAIFTALLIRSAYLERQIRDQMWQLWEPLRGGPIRTPYPPPGWIHRLRTSRGYQTTIGFLKWKVLPIGLGSAALCVVIVGVLALVGIPILRQQIAAREADGRLCSLGTPSETGGPFRTSAACWDSGTVVHREKTYEVELTVQEPWLDATIPASPLGIDDARFRFLLGYLGLPVRRTISGRWYQPFVTIGDDNDRHVQPLEFQDQGGRFVAQLKPKRSGRVALWVNDGVFSLFGYDNNSGTASVKIVEQPSQKSR